jgi:lipooligosaccharide transport system ATP-binding protein
MKNAIIEASRLTKRYAEHSVVDNVDIEVHQGECWGLLGPNGAGKTTILRMLIGSTPPSSGRLALFGYSIPADAVLVRRRIGVVPQKDNLDPDFTVAENLLTYASFFGLRGLDVQRRIEELLVFAALENRRDAHINALSGGMLRRLSLIRALINQPALLILDEPTTGLDPQARQLLWQRLRTLRSRGMTLILTTHYMEEAQRLCDRITIMDQGRILDTDTPVALIRKNVEPHVIEVFGQDLIDWHGKVGGALADRSERVGETVFYYAQDERPLLAALSRRPDLTYLHRPANLEDVFVKLTGRELRDGQ